MTAPRHVAVIDIGKTNAKLALVDAETLTEIAVFKTPNCVSLDGLYPHHDVNRLWAFIVSGLADLARMHPIDAISVTTHGATAALLDADGELALPILDYEHDGPDQLAAEYDALRPPFSETGTPRLPAGLNLGAQIHWQSKAHPERFAAVRSILTYPQYWAYRLTGVQAVEVTSLGCHTDLWNLARRDFSTLVDQMDWRRLMPPLRQAGDRLGPVLPDVAVPGLSPQTPVFCGLHNSNASLLPHVLTRRQPFSVVSTGTWVVAMAIGGTPRQLDPGRDTLINVNALGEPVPSARFMGGREFETLMAGHDGNWAERDVEAVLAGKILLMPSVQPGCGPFPVLQARWIGGEPSAGERMVAVSFYLALMTATCLGLIGAEGEIVIEGPFAKNVLFAGMLQVATSRPVLRQEGHETGTTIGAMLLSGLRPSASKPMARAEDAAPGSAGDDWRRYADTWLTAVL